MTHLGYVVSAYLAGAIVILGMVAFVVTDLGAQKRKLDRLEEAGHRRRAGDLAVSETAHEGAAASPRAPRPVRPQLWLFIPLFIFLALAVLFLVRLGAGDPSRVPSALLNKPVPSFSLPPIEDSAGGGLADADLQKGVHLVNVWASWCGPCRLEHPILMQLAEDHRFTLVGINYKDVPENAARFLGTFGDPFAKVGTDRDGKTGIDWGVYGVPETFVVKDGIIVYKFVGPLEERSLASDLMPAIEKALRPTDGQ